MTPTTLLIDRRNVAELLPEIVKRVSEAELIGIDCETEDSRRHPGLEKVKGMVFDINRTTMTGFSIYPDGTDVKFYINLAHADVENWLTFHEVRPIIEAKRPDATWIAHNAKYEITMFDKCHGVRLDPAIICTMQMAVSAYGPDEYDHETFLHTGIGDMRKLIGQIARVFAEYKDGAPMTPEQADVFWQVAGKQSDASHSYNGYIKLMAYGYGLKQAVASFFGVQMQTFKGALSGREHMGQLTGEEVAEYGADDAYWCVRLFHHLLDFMMETNPKVVETFFNQENVVVPMYADIWSHGVRVNMSAVQERLAFEKNRAADVLRGLKIDIRALFPFKTEPPASLSTEDWYTKNGPKYRKRIEDWANSPDGDDATVLGQISGPLAGGKTPGPNLTHYMPIRTIVYDLLRQKAIYSDGKLQSDGDARGKMLERTKDEMQKAVLLGLAKLAAIDQTIKLYLNPYMNLADPDTGCLYPDISSMLATRRMSMTNPNAQQLAKRGESVYVRGFYLADDDEQVIISADWNSVELVLPAEFSGDPEFVRCFSQIPYDDLHSIAAATVLSVKAEREITVEEFKALKTAPDTVKEIAGIRLANNRGLPLKPKDFFTWARTTLGKGSNFEYIYSGALGTVGDVMGWEPSEMWAAVEKYRSRFPVFEEWRQAEMRFVQENGYVELPDGHRRVRFEATPLWRNYFARKFSAFDVSGVQNFVRLLMKKIQTRARNQAVNAKVQGSAATLMKRSMFRLKNELIRSGLKSRLMFPVHDELVVSSHRDEAIPTINIMRQVMTDHPDLVSRVKLNVSVAVGRTFQPFHPEKAPFGQIELDEAPAVPWINSAKHGKRLNEHEISMVLEYLREDQKMAA